MKRNILPIVTALFLSGNFFAQVGINTSTPKTTMDVSAKRDGTGAITDNAQILGLQAPRVTRGELTSNTGTYGNEQRGALIYITDISTGNLTGTRVNVNAIGYYYFDGAVWQKIISGSAAAANIYTSDGTIQANRTVNMDDKTLSFTSSATTGTQHFNVDGSTLSVDAVNNRVGIGTTSPSSLLQVVNAVGGNLTDAFSAGINNCGSPCSQGTARNIVIYNANGTNTSFGSIDFVPSASSTGVSGAIIKGIDRNAGSNFSGLAFQTRGDTTGLKDRLVIKSTGNVGVGTTDNPTEQLDVNGNTRIRGLVDGSDASTFTRSVVAKNDGTLGYASLSVSSYQLRIPPHSSSIADFTNHANTNYDSDNWWVISKSSTNSSNTFTTSGNGLLTITYTTTATSLVPPRMTIVYEYQGTVFADPSKIFPQLTAGNNGGFPDVYIPSFIRLETVGGKTRMTVTVVRADNHISGWAGTFLLNTLFVVKS